jgi:hypothetical protein
VRLTSKLAACAAAVALVAVSCGDTGEASPTGESPQASSIDDVFVVRASTDLAVGSERLLLGLAAADGRRLGSDELAASVAVWPEDDPSLRREVDASWVWAIPGATGLYRATVAFDRPGVWMAELIPATGARPAPIPLLVNAEPATAAVGSAAPPSDSPTASEDLAVISSDPEPDPRLYEMSIADAVGSGRPSVIAFSTPRFCQTAICGPTLEVVKSMVDDFPDVNFVHVEVYDLVASPPDATSVEELVVAPAVIDWGLTSEPWVFVVDAEGTIAGRFEGVVDAAELAALLG